MSDIICKTFEETLERGKRWSAKYYNHNPFYITPMTTLKGKPWFIAHLSIHPEALSKKVVEGEAIVTWNAEKRRWKVTRYTREDVEDLAAEMAAWSN